MATISSRKWLTISWMCGRIDSQRLKVKLPVIIRRSR